MCVCVYKCSYVEKTRGKFTKLLTSHLWDLALSLIFYLSYTFCIVGGFCFYNECVSFSLNQRSLFVRKCQFHQPHNIKNKMKGCFLLLEFIREIIIQYSRFVSSFLSMKCPPHQPGACCLHTQDLNWWSSNSY